MGPKRDARDRNRLTKASTGTHEPYRTPMGPQACPASYAKLSDRQLGITIIAFASAQNLPGKTTDSGQHGAGQQRSAIEEALRRLNDGLASRTSPCLCRHSKRLPACTGERSSWEYCTSLPHVAFRSAGCLLDGIMDSQSCIHIASVDASFSRSSCHQTNTQIHRLCGIAHPKLHCRPQSVGPAADLCAPELRSRARGKDRP